MRLYVPLNRQEYEALERLASAERRRPQDQAAAMLARLLDDDLAALLPNQDEAPTDGSRREAEEAGHAFR
jgi:hypothetical protein